MPLDTDIADPAPLGLTGFGLTTFMVGMLEAGLLSSDAIGVIIPLAMAYGGTIQFFAGLLAFREGNTFATTAFCTYGAFWWWFALVEWLGGALGMFPVPTVALGWALIGFGVITTYLWISTFRLNWGLWAVFLALASAYYLLGIGDVLGIAVLGTIGGYVAILDAIFAVYVAFAEVTNWSFAGTVVPLGGTPFGGSGSSADTAD
jgi:succinate-acetate transporter protein